MFILFFSLTAQDVLYKMLSLDPSERLSAEECLQHPYFNSYHDPEDEVSFLLFTRRHFPHIRIVHSNAQGGGGGGGQHMR